jgi:hypothetical protein
MTRFDGWEPLRDELDPEREKKLGSGGQGTVYLARSPERVGRLALNARSVDGLIRQATATIKPATWHEESVQKMSELAQKIVRLGTSDPVEDLGALKQFAIPADDKAEEARALGRLESEIRALKSVKHPAVLKLLHANSNQRFIVTEYHRRGTLSENLKLVPRKCVGGATRVQNLGRRSSSDSGAGNHPPRHKAGEYICHRFRRLGPRGLWYRVLPHRSRTPDEDSRRVGRKSLVDAALGIQVRPHRDRRYQSVVRRVPTWKSAVVNDFRTKWFSEGGIREGR